MDYWCLLRFSVDLLLSLLFWPLQPPVSHFPPKLTRWDSWMVFVFTVFSLDRETSRLRVRLSFHLKRDKRKLYSLRRALESASVYVLSCFHVVFVHKPALFTCSPSCFLGENLVRKSAFGQVAQPEQRVHLSEGLPELQLLFPLFLFDINNFASAFFFIAQTIWWRCRDSHSRLTLLASRRTRRQLSAFTKSLLYFYFILKLVGVSTNHCCPKPPFSTPAGPFIRSAAVSPQKDLASWVPPRHISMN